MIDAQEASRLKALLPARLHDLLPVLLEHAQLATIPEKQEILREGQYVKVVPILLTGLVKVLSRGDTRDLLLYYIEPGESCIMSFMHGLQQRPSSVYAITEETSEVLLIPTTLLDELVRESAALNRLFHDLGNQRYLDLLSTINQVFFEDLEQRLLDHLTRLSQLRGTKALTIKHQQIAEDLGTAREVVSRTLKKLEARKLLHLEKNQVILT